MPTYIPPVWPVAPVCITDEFMTAFTNTLATYVNSLQGQVDALAGGVDLSGFVTQGTLNAHAAAPCPHPGMAKFGNGACLKLRIENVPVVGGGGVFSVTYNFIPAFAAVPILSQATSIGPASASSSITSISATQVVLSYVSSSPSIIQLLLGELA